MRQFSIHLAESYKSAGLLEHKVTIGESRERQVIDMLRSLLPKRVEARKLTLIDRFDRESPSFDCVILDRTNFPLLYAEAGTEVAMVESASACIEVKSKLNSREVEDILRKVERLRQLEEVEGQGAPAVAVFAYTCSNLNLVFFDLAVAHASGRPVPDTVCVLNQALTSFVDKDTHVLGVGPEAGPTCLLPIGQDSLFVFFYLLCRWCAFDKELASVYRDYSAIFSGQEIHLFEADFIDAILRDEEREIARKEFKRGKGTMLEVYARARESLGLQAS